MRGRRRARGSWVGLAALVSLGACQRLLDLQPVHLTDAARDAPALPDGPDAALPPDATTALLVQEVSAASQNATALSVTLAANPSPQDLLVLIGGAENGVEQVTGAGVAWTVAASSRISPTIEIWYGVPDGSTPTVTATTQSGQIWLELTEWRGLDTAQAFDAGSGDGVMDTTSTSGTVKLAVDDGFAPDLLVFGIASYGLVGPPGAIWTSLKGVVASSVTQHAWYRIANTAGMQGAQTVYNNDYDAALAAFRTAP